jgi:hypothetical protein
LHPRTGFLLTGVATPSSLPSLSGWQHIHTRQSAFTRWAWPMRIFSGPFTICSVLALHEGGKSYRNCFSVTVWSDSSLPRPSV